MTYPIIIFLFLILAMVIVLVYVMPEVKEMFIDQGIDLPAATVALIATSDFLVNQYLFLIFLLIAATA
jgi:type II secretory pathway component PulF